jgi:hypothetical protein
VEDGLLYEIPPQLYSLEQGVAGIRHVFAWDTLAEVETIGLFSDGISQISTHTGVSASLSWIEVVGECLALKNTQGAFVKRRVRRALHSWATHGLLPQDDLSSAMIHVMPPPSGGVL